MNAAYWHLKSTRPLFAFWVGAGKRAQAIVFEVGWTYDWIGRGGGGTWTSVFFIFVGGVFRFRVGGDGGWATNRKRLLGT